ncbi:BspA family leucine-rich repeat surface protein [Allomuricauda sp. ARW1Y1]|uniref:BspA family leucine-rich repeat surface protein n=1 Tax=Allomuricauda sp. ARW1Y1 TaxID=2663843 RepID=UPI0015CE489E|nr:BspA family leucine-rich repeat surface protein [Muricauda sp. ARW1Y1]NYJ26697.1 surface protein [Muricauda sp. ARW1Y1]
MKVKHLLWSLLAIIVMWSCGKDDDPEPPAAAPTIANFTPESGPVGTEITINGTNFSTTVASNTVKIGTATATVTAATATQLKATVPTGATTAKVTVTVGGKTATSTKDFTVTVPNEDDPNGDDPNGDDPNGDDPTNEAPTAEDQSFEVAEDESLIGSVEGSDPEGDELTFALVTDESELFQVAENGEISLAEGKNLDFETATEHTLTLSVSDGTNEPVEFTVTVKVVNVIDTLFEDPASFIMEFDVAAGQELKIGLNNQYEYNYSINWGDGTEENYTTNENPTHTYDNADTYTIAIKGVFPALRMGFADIDSRSALVDVAQWGTNVWQSMANAFASCTNLIDFSATDVPDLSEVVDMNSMFSEATLFNGNIGDWDTGNVTNMYGIFANAHAFNQPLVQTEGGWNTSKVTNMSFMFYNEGGTHTFNQDLSSWDTSNVTDMSYMFSSFGGSHAFNQDLSSWDTSNVTDMIYMFYNEGGSHAFDQSLAAWDIGSVTDMSYMLSNSGMSPENYSATLIGWGNKADDQIPDYISLGPHGLEYCSGVAVSFAISNLTNPVANGGNGWTINHAGAVNCP